MMIDHVTHLQSLKLVSTLLPSERRWHTIASPQRRRRPGDHNRTSLLRILVAPVHRKRVDA